MNFEIVFQIIFNVSHQLDCGRRESGHKGESGAEFNGFCLQENLEAVSEHGPRVPPTGQSSKQHLGGLLKIIPLCANAVEPE